MKTRLHQYPEFDQFARNLLDGRTILGVKTCLNGKQYGNVSLVNGPCWADQVFATMEAKLTAGLQEMGLA